MPRLDRWLTKSEKVVRDSDLDLGRIYMAEVMDTRNLTRSGEIKVWVVGSNIPKDDSTRWLTANYASNFYGTSPYEANDMNSFEYNAPVSFGAWFPMPFVGNYVFIFYPAITGENVSPYWFACPVNPMMNSMIPGIPSQYFGSNKEPLCEMNDKLYKNVSAQRGATLIQRESGRPIYTPLKNALEEQGLSNDNLRGYSTSGSKREAPSMCYGFLTPFGNSFTIDDGWSEEDSKQNWSMGNDNRELRNNNGQLPTHDLNVKRNDAGFRLRTRNGTQLLISDDGTIYAINKQGTAWLELTEDGRILAYANSSIDMSTDGDINLKAGKKIRMEADEGISMKTSKDMSIQAAGNINVSTPRVVAETEITVPKIKAEEGIIDTLQSGAAEMRGMFQGSLDGVAYYATYAGTLPVQQPIPMPKMSEIDEPTLEEIMPITTTVGKTIDSICTEVTAHEPYSGHINNSPDYEAEILDIVSQPYNVRTNDYTSPIVSNQLSEVCPVPPDTSKDTTIPQMQLSEHFTLADLCYSDTAYRRKINNVPQDSEIAKLRILCEQVLEPIWTHFNKRVIVNSGYRGRALNAAVGGATTSQHCYGEAADIEIAGVSNYDLAVWIRDNIQFDQLILEFANNLSVDPNSGWVHVSYREGRLRHSVLTINNRGTRQGLIK